MRLPRHAPLRFSELERLVEGANQKMLIQQLKQLEKDGIVVRKVYPQVPPRVEYPLGELGVALGPSMEALIEWAEMRRRLRGEAPGG
ncbi:DNA-binding HxlR family transcriptional regulator [Paraburkholderia youngii]